MASTPPIAEKPARKPRAPKAIEAAPVSYAAPVSASTGRISQVIGAVVDVTFTGSLPDPFGARDRQ